jgi:hypothetical protein
VLVDKTTPDYTLPGRAGARALTASLVQGLAVNNTLIVAHGSNHTRDLLLNFLAHLNKLGALAPALRAAGDGLPVMPDEADEMDGPGPAREAQRKKSPGGWSSCGAVL